MFGRFTDRAKRVLVSAQDEAEQLGHDFLGCEHILLGMLREGEGIACEVLAAASVTADDVESWIVGRRGRNHVDPSAALASIGIDLDEVRRRLEETFGEGSLPGNDRPPFTPKAKRTLELARDSALRLGHNSIGTEHLLLGLIDQHDNLACELMAENGIDLLELSTATVDRVAPESIRARDVAARAFKLVAAARAKKDNEAALAVATELGGQLNAAMRDQLTEVKAASTKLAVVLEAATADAQARLTAAGVAIPD